MSPKSGNAGHFVFIFTLTLFAALDLWSKHAAFQWVGPPPDEKIVVDGFLSFRQVLNPGMMWGMAQEVTALWWVVIRSGVLLGLLWLYFTLPGRTRFTQFAFGLVAAGAIGNIADNVFQGEEALFTGKVRDFIHMLWIDFPTFNVADSCICVGAPLLLIILWNADRKEKQAQAEAATKPAA